MRQIRVLYFCSTTLTTSSSASWGAGCWQELMIMFLAKSNNKPTFYSFVVYFTTLIYIYISTCIASSDTMIGGWQIGRAMEESDRGLNWGAVPQGCTLGRAATSPPTHTLKFKKHRSCRHDDIKRFAWFTLQPKSETQISWWLVR